MQLILFCLGLANAYSLSYSRVDHEALSPLPKLFSGCPSEALCLFQRPANYKVAGFRILVG